MKLIIKYFIKLVFVVVLPASIVYYTISSIAFYNCLIPVTIITNSFILIIIIGLTIFNAVFYFIHMSNTYLLPKIKIITRIGIGIDLVRTNTFNAMKRWELNLPFITIIFLRRF